MDLKNIVRTSAIIYADEMNQRTTETIRRKFVEAVFVSNNNALMSIVQIANAIEDILDLTFLEEEIRKIVGDNEYFIEILRSPRENTMYKLVEQRYRTLSNRCTQNIKETIERYINANTDLIVSKDEFEEIINKYLYSLLNKNILSYQQVINPVNGKFKDFTIDSFSTKEIEIINQFLLWDDENKNKDLFKLISYCVEYAIIVNNSSEQVLTNSLRNKVFYLDNAFIYRMLGINGETRKRRALSFIKKCKENGQKLKISKFTKQEFIDTIDYHINLLNRSTPFGKISPTAFKIYANGGGVYEFYHNWRNGRIAYGFDLFKAYILGEYNNLISTYNIEEDYKVPFDEKESIEIVQKYADEIGAIKQTNRPLLHFADAQNMYWIEIARQDNNISISDTQYYFVTSDQKLQLWDNEHSTNQPITLLPSQWMGLLLKYVSRTNDDFKSFVSFLSIPQNEPVISPDDLQTIMAGISEITEDFIRQNNILEEMVSIKFEGIINDHTQLSAKTFAKEKIEQEFEQKLERKEFEKEQVKQDSAKKIEAFILESKTSRLRDVCREIDRQEKVRDTINKKVHQRISRWKTFIMAVDFIAILILVILIFHLGWNKMGPWTYLIGIALIFFPKVYVMIYGKSFNIKKYMEKKGEEYYNSLCEQFAYSKTELDELNLIKKQLEKELGLKQ